MPVPVISRPPTRKAIHAPGVASRSGPAAFSAMTNAKAESERDGRDRGQPSRRLGPFKVRTITGAAGVGDQDGTSGDSGPHPHQEERCHRVAGAVPPRRHGGERGHGRHHEPGERGRVPPLGGNDEQERGDRGEHGRGMTARKTVERSRRDLTDPEVRPLQQIALQNEGRDVRTNQETDGEQPLDALESDQGDHGDQRNRSQQRGDRDHVQHRVGTVGQGRTGQQGSPKRGIPEQTTLDGANRHVVDEHEPDPETEPDQNDPDERTQDAAHALDPHIPILHAIP